MDTQGEYHEKRKAKMSDSEEAKEHEKFPENCYKLGERLGNRFSF